MRSAYIGIDNGVTGSICVIDLIESSERIAPIPTFVAPDYQKSGRNITRIDVNRLKEILEPYSKINSLIGLEKPMVNPNLLLASFSALRALEATLIVIESLKMKYVYIGSKDWQKHFYGKAVSDKKLFLQIAKRYTRIFDQGDYKDADAFLIAKYMQEKNM